jgi:hypothetical protein
VNQDDLLRSRESRREEPLDAHASEPITSREDSIDPEQEALMADSVGLALLVVLDTLNPAGCEDRERRWTPTPISLASATWLTPVEPPALARSPNLA